MNVNFAKTLHMKDYFYFLSMFFHVMGYAGWVILFDEAELMGRLSKKARLNFYRNMDAFLNPEERLIQTFSMFAFTDSYVAEVIEHKHDLKNLEELFPENQEPMRKVIDQITRSYQLMPLSEEEIIRTVRRIRDFHAAAYDWQPGIAEEELFRVAYNSGYLLRTRLRAVIETLDQEYQYGDAEEISVNDLRGEDYTEEEPLSLDSLNEP